MPHRAIQFGHRPDDLPDEVSDLYWTIKDEVSRQLPRASEGKRFVILAIAYTKYSQDKKIRCDTLRKKRTPEALRIIHRDMIDGVPDYVPRVVGDSVELFIGSLREGGTGFAIDAIRNSKPKILDDVKSHVMTLSIVGVAILLYEAFGDDVGHFFAKLIHGHVNWTFIRKIGEYIVSTAIANGG